VPRIVYRRLCVLLTAVPLYNYCTARARKSNRYIYTPERRRSANVLGLTGRGFAYLFGRTNPGADDLKSLQPSPVRPVLDTRGVRCRRRRSILPAKTARAYRSVSFARHQRRSGEMFPIHRSAVNLKALVDGF